MTLGLTQPRSEMSTKGLIVGKGLPARKADNLTAICESIVCKSGSFIMACYEKSFRFILGKKISVRSVLSSSL
jgi:hypothetical protein